jgi:hypothetical protein
VYHLGAVAQFKGTIYTSAQLFTESRFGPDAVQRVLAALPAPDRKLLTEITPIGWYPTEPVMAFHHKLDELFGKGDLTVCVELGKYSAEWALNTVLKFFIRFRTPSWLLERSGSLWSRYHDSGRWEVVSSPNLQLSARLHDFQVRDPAFCARFRGWLHRAVELTGGRDPDVREPLCLCKGEPYCEYSARWK